ncbi:MAG TPA: hypothetical protein VFA07_16455 [Chthonomonadaceae bacterium]|nr:hypothetical protein [Chthonomonadaceae bacterium]
MTDPREQSLDAEIRRRRLDDLFADEPYLSTTMKARRLHEKLQELRAREQAVQEPPTDARLRERSSPPGAENSDPALLPEESGVDERSQAVDRVSLVRAAEYLRAGTSPGQLEPPYAARLLHFREQVLMKWLECAPEKETS